MTQETIEQKFDVSEKPHLRLSNIRGSIEIVSGDESVVEVKAVKHLRSGNHENTEVIIECEKDDHIYVKTEFDKSLMNWFGMNKPCKVEYRVQVPKNCDLRVSGVTCGISVKNISGNIDITSVSGGLDLSNLSGNLKFGSVSGSIKGGNLIGDLDTNTVSGRIRMMGSDFPMITMKTVSGSMVVETPISDGPYMFKSVSGNATVIVPENSGCSAVIKSMSGRLRTSHPISKDRRYGAKGFVEIAGGGPEITYKSVSGSLRIVNEEGEKITEQKAHVKVQEDPKNQMEILKKIESGEMSVEDALVEMKS